MAIVYGSNASETIDAADGVGGTADTIYGYGGADTIFGLGGNDFIIGGAGGDTIDGGEGSDTAFYSDSGDAVTVSLATGKGNGGTAEGDKLKSIENLYGSAFDDMLTGNSADNILAGMDGDDMLKGGGGADTLNGGDDDDLLIGGSGGDKLYGGAGIDTASYVDSAEGVSVSLHGQWANFGGTSVGDTYSGVENLTGSYHNDRLDGDNKANVLIGLDGNDTLVGYGGADTMIGGLGNDDYYVHDQNDVVVEAIGEGDNDHLSTVVSYKLAAGIEIEEIYVNGESSDYDIDLTGNEFSQYFQGNEGKNIIDGGGGTDTMMGWSGDDTYYVDSSDDVVIEKAGAGEGNDIVHSKAFAYTLADNVEILSLDSGTGKYGTGNAGNNTIFGNAGTNVLDGGGGADFLNGLGGDDSFTFKAGEANGDVVWDFQGNGAGVGDYIYFSGYGTLADGATLAQLTATTWQVNSADGLTHDIITFDGGVSLGADDFIFL